MAVPRIEIWLNNKWVHHSIRLILAALVTVLLAPLNLDFFEYSAYDLWVQLSPKPNPSGDIVLVRVDSDTVKALSHEPEALDWAVALQKLGQAKPGQIVSLINPTQIQGSYEDLSMLSDIARHLPFQYAEDDLPKTGMAKLEPMAPPFENVPIEPAPKTSDLYWLAKDGVTRRVIVNYEGQFTLHPKLAAKFNGIHNVEEYSGTFQLVTSTQMLIRYRKPGVYPILSFSDLVEGKFDKDFFKDKIVFIGHDTKESATDYVTTPLVKNLISFTALELNANIMDTLISNDAPRIAPAWLKWLFTFTIGMLTIYIVLSVRPGKGLLLLAGSVVGFLAVTWVVFIASRWLIPVGHPLVAVFICYYFVIPYRLIIENRRSWEYYQKNRLLTQVEELKSNFMRMMSHDLKTPLARIQGMTDVIRENQSLTPTQRHALDTISKSSDDLTDFIASILSLSRIESKEVKLHLRSRDVNQVLRSVIQKADYLSKSAGVEVITELEPLFSIKIDENLLQTVFTNLVENAIKYSPKGSRVLVTTEEINNEVVIQVADQGRGIAPEDINLVFERFYRGSNSRSDTAGNGLGLYLAKYVVELHNGSIEVESALEQGSTFTVRLPMNLNLDNNPVDHDPSQDLSMPPRPDFDGDLNANTDISGGQNV